MTYSKSHYWTKTEVEAVAWWYKLPLRTATIFMRRLNQAIVNEVVQSYRSYLRNYESKGGEKDVKNSTVCL